jgi:membrane associated rhomboid family serine protease
MSNKITNEIGTQAKILGGFVSVFWIVEIIDRFVFRGALDRFGIQPHSFVGLRGILLAPFLHGNFAHLIGNTIPFIILGWLVMLQETSDFFIVTLFTMFVGGMGVWIFGSPLSVHIGASILIFGFLGFLLLRGFFQRNLPSIAISIVVTLLYGSLIWGVLPLDPKISWQGHLFGFIGGAIAAKLIAREKKFYQ